MLRGEDTVGVAGSTFDKLASPIQEGAMLLVLGRKPFAVYKLTQSSELDRGRRDFSNRLNQIAWTERRMPESKIFQSYS
jgi:hypothetical protein